MTTYSYNPNPYTLAVQTAPMFKKAFREGDRYKALNDYIENAQYLFKGGKADFSVDDINTVMQMCYNRGGQPTVAVMSGAKKRRFSEIMSGLTTTMRQAGDDRIDMVVSAYQSDFGMINAHAHRLYPDDRIDILDMRFWDQKWFQEPSRITNLAKKGSYQEFAIESWFGLQGTQPKASGSVTGLLR